MRISSALHSGKKRGQQQQHRTLHLDAFVKRPPSPSIFIQPHKNTARRICTTDRRICTTARRICLSAKAESNGRKGRSRTLSPPCIYVLSWEVEVRLRPSTHFVTNGPNLISLSCSRPRHSCSGRVLLLPAGALIHRAGLLARPWEMGRKVLLLGAMGQGATVK